MITDGFLCSRPRRAQPTPPPLVITLAITPMHAHTRRRARALSAPPPPLSRAGDVSPRGPAPRESRPPHHRNGGPPPHPGYNHPAGERRADRELDIPYAALQRGGGGGRGGGGRGGYGGGGGEYALSHHRRAPTNFRPSAAERGSDARSHAVRADSLAFPHPRGPSPPLASPALAPSSAPAPPLPPAVLPAPHVAASERAPPSPTALF